MIRGGAAVAILGLILNAASARAQLQDLRLIEETPERVTVWAAFAATPSAAEAEIEAGRAVVRLTGAPSETRRIEPAIPSALSRVHVDPAPEGIALTLSGPWRAVSVDRAAGGVWIRLERAPIPQRAALSASGPSLGFPSDATPPRSAATDTGSIPALGDLEAPPETPAPAPPPQAPAIVSEESAPAAPAPDAGAPQSPCADILAQLDDDPWNLTAMTAHGRCLQESGDPQAAAEIFERILAFEPGRFDAAMALGEMQAALGDTEAARALYESAARNAANDGQALQARAALADLDPD